MLDKVVIKNFKGLSDRYNARLIADDKSPDLTGMFVSAKGGLSPIPLINSESVSSLGFSNVTSMVPVVFSSGDKYLLVTDGEYWAKTTGDGVYSYIGYTSGTVARSGTALTGTTTAWATNIVAGDQFKYDADSTWLNVSVVGSDTSITLTSGSGATSGAYMIRKKMSKAVRPKGVVLNDLAILSDGVRIHDKWDGTSQVAIASMPILRGLELHKRHIFGFTRDSIYWSNINVPTTWTGTDLEAVATKDGGDLINIKSFANMLVLFKSSQRIYQFIGDAPFEGLHPTYSIIEADVPTNLGTTAPETVSIHNGLLRFLTNNGVYDYDGVRFELVTRDIQTTMDMVVLPVPPTGTSFLDSAAADFALGTFAGTEYSTTRSALQLDRNAVLDQFTDGDFTANPAWTPVIGSWSVVTTKLTVSKAAGVSTGRQIYVSSINAYGQWTADIGLTIDAGNGGFADWCFVSGDSSGNSSYILRVNLLSGSSDARLLRRSAGGAETVLLTMPNIGLVSGNNYAFQIIRSASGDFIISQDGNLIGTVTDTTFTTSLFQVLFVYTNDAITAAVSAKFDNFLQTSFSGAQNFISRVFDGTTALTQWQSIVVNSVLNGESVAVAYRAEATNPPVGAFTTLTSGQTITTNKTNRYLQYRIGFTSSNKIGISSDVISVTVNYLLPQDTVNKPVAVSFKDRWHLSYGAGGSLNTDTLIQDEFGEWAKWSAQAACFAVFNNVLYAGHVDATIKTWFNGSTAVGESRSWKSKVYDFDLPEQLKDFDRVTIVFKFTSAVCSLDYSIDEGTFVTNSVSLASGSNTDIPVRTVQIAKTGTHFQLRFVVTDETTTFEIYAFILHLKVLELR